MLDALVGRDGGGGAKASPSQFPSPKPNARLDYDVPLRHSDYGAEARLDVRNPTGYASEYPYPSDYRLEGLAPLPPLRDKALGYQPDVPLREPELTRTPRRLRWVRTGYAYQPPALGTYRTHRAALPQGPTYSTWSLGASRPAPPVRTQRGRLVRVACTYPTEAPGRTCQLRSAPMSAWFLSRPEKRSGCASRALWKA